MLTRLGRTYRALFYGSTGTLSMGRVLVALGVLQVFASIWLFTAWIAYVTLTGQMEAASPLASSIGTVLSAVLSSQVASIAATWWTSKRYGDNGSATAEQVDGAAGPGGI